MGRNSELSITNLDNIGEGVTEVWQASVLRLSDAEQNILFSATIRYFNFNGIKIPFLIKKAVIYKWFETTGKGKRRFLPSLKDWISSPEFYERKV